MEFIQRFVEACGSNEPSKVQRLLNISYQTAKNYLHGRMPDSSVLQKIASRTPYSIHWLLTGQGEKFVFAESREDTPLLTGQIRDLIRDECVEVINEMIGSYKITHQKVVVLQSDKLRSEKVMESETIPEKQS
jgi:hypothetical protein